MAPSQRLMTPSSAKKSGRKAIRKIKKKFSRLILLSTFMPLLKKAAKPATKLILIRLEPMILPSDKEGVPPNAEEMPINNSGIEVAALIKKKEIIYSES